MTVPEPLYLDYAATTPVDPAVAAAMGSCLAGPDGIGNASSITHFFGRRAAERIERARGEVAALIGAAPGEIVFTSGATESDNLAVLGAARANAHRGRHIVSSRIEHKAVLDPVKRLEKEGFAVTLLPPDRSGRIDPNIVSAALRADTVLVSIMLVNNEIGVIQDIASIGDLCRARGVLFHSDAAQAAGRIPIDVHALPVDLMSITAHKLYGPKGIGALYVRSGARARLQPIVFGGGQENGLRPGTLPTHQIAGFGVACDIARRSLGAEGARLAGLRERLWQGLASLGGVHANGEGAPCVPGILNVSFEGVEGESLVAGLCELAVSTGSACNSASAEPSYVLRALGRDTQVAQSSLRLSFGRFSLPQHIDVAVEAIRREVTRLRALSPASEPAGAPSSPAQVVGEAGGPGREVWVRFRLSIGDGLVKAALFKAYGCPHTLAVAAWVAERLRGRGRADLAPGTPAEWAEALAVPVEKLGRLLVVEDALADCARHWPERE
ncbi:MAG: aminotransferase class V-fold PLP-dependent enzyme [Gammaproteobacteria bacterium]|nr:aminotransferase class V-fold PLP-dependent enzyme [Gammaproteobacteria bacterium]